MQTSAMQTLMAAPQQPTVSVVIPTRNRPLLLNRAIQSVFEQTLQCFEILVVVDGPDDETLSMLSGLANPRLRVLALEESVGGSEARNTGVRQALAPWIALLDDDDVWLPSKLEQQLAAARQLPGTRIVVTCRYYDRDGSKNLLRPRRFPRPDQPISDFLYSEATWLGSIEGFPQTSTWFIARSFLLEVPFRKGLRRNQDTDWVLQALRLPGVQLALVKEPLSIFYNESRRERITQKLDWRDSYDWAMSHRDIFTPRALSTVLAIMCMNHAARSRSDLKTMRVLLGDARRYGAVTPKILWLFLLYGLLYGNLRSILSPGLRRSVLYFTSRARGGTA